MKFRPIKLSHPLLRFSRTRARDVWVIFLWFAKKLQSMIASIMTTARMIGQASGLSYHSDSLSQKMVFGKKMGI